MIRKLSRYIICVLLAGAIGLTAACTAPAPPPDFSDPDTAAYINGTRMSASKMAKYIDIKTAYMQALADAGEDETQADQQQLAFDTVSYLRALEYLAFSDEEKQRDYLRMAMVALDEFEATWERETTDASIRQIAEDELQRVLSGETDGSQVFIPEVVQSVADDYGLTFEQCAETIYMSFYIIGFRYDYAASNHYFKTLHKQPVDFDEVDIVVYTDYLMGIYTAYDSYLDAALEDADVVFPPEE